jgi:photosystem II stability/assembly factor-like uncharacterized protein
MIQFIRFLGLLILLLIPLKTWAQWQKVNLPAGFEDGYYLDVFFLPSDPQYGWICGFDGMVLKTTDGGNTWIGIRLPVNAFLESIHFPNKSRGYASGPGGVFRTDDGGNTWFPLNLPGRPSQIWGTYFVSADTGYVVGSGCGDEQHFYRTTNGGLSWSLFLGSEPNSGLTDVIVYSGNGLGYAVSSGVIWQTLNGGITWQVFADSGPKYWNEEITQRGNSFLLPSSGNDCSGGAARDSGGARFTTDMGRTWKITFFPHAMFGSFLIDEKKGWVSGDEGAVYYTSDAGQSWQQKDCGLDKANIDDMWFIDDSTGWAVGEGVFRLAKPQYTPFTIQTNPSPPFCSGDIITLKASPGYRDYRWNGVPRPDSIQVSSPGNYIVTAINPYNCTVVSDTLIVSYLPAPQLDIRLDKAPILCFGDTLIAIATPGFRRYLWSDGDTTRIRTITNGGIYTVQAWDSNGCRATAQTPFIKKSGKIEPKINVLGKTVLCRKESTVLSAPAGFIGYKWQQGSTDKDITVSKEGYYYVDVVDTNGCVGRSDTIKIVVLDIDNKIEILENTGYNLDFGGVNLGSDTCFTLHIRNKDLISDLYLPYPFLLHNRVFSSPAAQYPILVKPGDTARLLFCFYPLDTLLTMDTVVFRDTCSPVYLSLSGFGITVPINGSDACNLPVKGNIISLGTWPGNFPPHIIPLPTTTVFTVKNQEFSHQSGFEEYRIIDAMGRELLRQKIVSALQQIQMPAQSANGIYVLQVIGSQGGIYSIAFPYSSE